jgi:Transposase DDE domain
MRTALARALSVDDVNQLGRETGQSQRLRTVTPHRLFLATIAALAGGRVETLADLLREFNHQNGVCVAYKAFYNRLARAGFAGFMRQMFVRLVGKLAVHVLEPAGGAAVARFRDIVIQDGSSFALKDDLADVFSGRFTNVQPAAVEVHATYSGFADDVITVHVAPDSEAERQFLPSPESLRDRLLLADRGYPSVGYFSDIDDNGGAYVIRLTRSTDPWVLAAIVDGERRAIHRPIKLSAFIERNHGSRMDVDVEFERHGRVHLFRVLVLPGRDKWMTWLATNLPRSTFSAALVAKLYRFRWQIELCFKEWKSYANLHKFNTANRYIVEGLIWASLCAAVLKRFLAHAAQLVGGVAISTRRVAMCAHYVVVDLLDAIRRGTGLRDALGRALAFLVANARRADPDRDRRTGRLRAGLVLVGADR